MDLRIATFNVNGVNGRLPRLLEWLAETSPDIVCLQEIKTDDTRFPARALEDAGYGAVWHGQRAHHGVAILARGETPAEIRRGLPGDPEDVQARYLEAEVKGLVVASIYLPNGNPQPGPKFDYKLAWFQRLVSHADGLVRSKRPVILAGDFNVVPTKSSRATTRRCGCGSLRYNPRMSHPKKHDAGHSSIALGEDWGEIREGVRAVCADYPGAYWRELDEKGDYPTRFVEALTQAGYLAALIPEEYGGSGLPLRAACAILEEIHASGCNAAACHAQMYTMGTVLRHGSESQKRAYLPEIAAGRLRLQAFGVTEPTTGSDTTQLKTRAEKQADGSYRVTGQKVWISRALYSDLMLLLARTRPVDECKRKSDGLSVFLVDLRQARGHGLEIRKLDAMINHNTTELFFDGLAIPADCLIGEEHRGFRYILDGMNAERILIAAECLGDARFFIDRAKQYATERHVFGRPIGQNQGVQFPIARAYAEFRAAELMNRVAAGLFDTGQECGEEANMAKLLASEASWHAGEAAMQTHGGFAFAREYDIERKWRETRLYQIAPISTNLILSYLGEHVLGMPRSY